MRPVHTAVRLPVSAAVAAKSAGVHTHASSSSSSGSSSSAGSSARVATASGLAILLAYAISELEGEQFAELRAQLSSKLTELRALVGLDLQVAECEKLNFEAARAVTAQYPIVGEDFQLASNWRRFFSWLIDNVLLMVLEAFSAQLLNYLFIGDSPARAFEISFSGASPAGWIDLALNLFMVVLFDATFLTMLNGQTPGKLLLGIRTAKRDFTPMDLPTALKHGVVRGLAMPVAMADIWVPYLPYNPVERITGYDLRQDQQLLHNWWSDTRVVNEKIEEDDE